MATTPVELYRSVRKEDFPNGVIDERGDPAGGVLFPDFYAKPLPNGSTRDPDVDLYKKEGVEWVKTGGGTSLFDVKGVFKGKSWLIFTIPSGTEIPDSLKVRKTHYSDKFKAWHYQIEALAAMRKDAYQGALDNLARNAIVAAVNAAKV